MFVVSDCWGPPFRICCAIASKACGSSLERWCCWPNPIFSSPNLGTDLEGHELTSRCDQNSIYLNTAIPPFITTDFLRNGKRNLSVVCDVSVGYPFSASFAILGYVGSGRRYYALVLTKENSRENLPSPPIKRAGVANTPKTYAV